MEVQLTVRSCTYCSNQYNEVIGKGYRDLKFLSARDFVPRASELYAQRACDVDGTFW